jgi:hypothetical protein
MNKLSLRFVPLVLFSTVLFLTACSPIRTSRLDPNSDLTNAEPQESTKKIHFEVINPLDLERPGEIFVVSATFPDNFIDQSVLEQYWIYAFVENKPNAILSEYLHSSVSYWDSGSIKELSFLLQDDFSALEKKPYVLSFDRHQENLLEPLHIEEVPCDGFGDFLHVNNGSNDFFIGHDREPLDVEFNGLLPKDLYIRMENEAGWTKTYALTHIYGNIPEYRQEFLNSNQCEPIYILSPGFPEKIDTVVTGLTARISLTYDGYTQELCPPFEEFEDPQKVDFYEAEVIILLYRQQPRIDISSTVVLQESFYNHNGFAIGGLETEIDRPLVLFGDDDHTILNGSVWADTEELTDLPEFMQIENGKFVFRRGGNRDAWGPFTTLKEVNQFHDYYVVQGKNDRAGLLYFPTYQSLAYTETRDEGSAVLPLNMIGAGPSIPLMVPNPVILSQTHLGGLGEIWAEITPGVYAYKLTSIMDLPFGIEYIDDYDQLIATLSSPLNIDVPEELSSGISLTIRAPSNFNSPLNIKLNESRAPSMPSPATVTPLPTIPVIYQSMIDLKNHVQNSNAEYLFDEGVLKFDQTERTEWIGFESPNSIKLDGPFEIKLNLSGAGDDYYVSLFGRRPSPDRSWWGEGMHVMYISQYSSQGDYFLRIYDGIVENNAHDIQLSSSLIRPNSSITLRFLDSQGRILEVFNEKGTIVSRIDITDISGLNLPQGLLPEEVLIPGILVGPGSKLIIREFELHTFEIE